MKDYGKYDGSRLAQMVRDGDKSAFDWFVLRYHTLVVRFISGVTGDTEASRDLAQNVFLKLWTGRHKIDDTKPLKSYLFTIAKNDALNYLKSRVIKYGTRLDDITDYLDSSYIPDANVLLRDALSNIKTSVESMPEQRKKIFIMHRLEELKSEEIAEQLGISKRTVDKHIQLADNDVRRKLN